MRNALVIAVALVVSLTGRLHAGAATHVSHADDDTPERELYVPFDELDVLLEAGPKRVLLTRAEYRALVAEADIKPVDLAPVAAAVVAASYTIDVEQGRAIGSGTLSVDVLRPGVHAVPLPLGGVGLRSATVDNQAAAIGPDEKGNLNLLIEGVGTHVLKLDMVMPVAIDSARQSLNFRVPTPAATTCQITVPGDVELQRGAPLISRSVDDASSSTQLAVLLPRDEPAAIELTLNSRLKRDERLVVARGAQITSLSQSGESLYATLSLGVLHQAVDAFTFAVPRGFEVTRVEGEAVSRWTVRDEADGAILSVSLREPTTGSVVLRIAAQRQAPSLDAWTASRIVPLNVASDVGIVGLMVDRRLEVSRVASEDLIHIDARILASVLPASADDAAAMRPVVAYYAPQADFSLAAHVERTPVRLRASTSLLLHVRETGLELRGVVTLLPTADDHFWFDLTMPPGWRVAGAVDAADRALDVADRSTQDGSERQTVRIRLHESATPQRPQVVTFTATRVPSEWLSEWDKRTLTFPAFTIESADFSRGVLAVAAYDDMLARPTDVDGPTPLDDDERAEHGLVNVRTDVAYRYDRQPYALDIELERGEPRLIARTHTFFRIDPEVRHVHAELRYDVTRARTRDLQFSLPTTTPKAIAITGLNGTTVKSYTSRDSEDGRRVWTAVLANPSSGSVSLAVDYEERVTDGVEGEHALPIPTAEGVAYQSGLVAIEGHAELDISLTDPPRPVDVGELVDATYQPGKRLLGAYEFVGSPKPIDIEVGRGPQYDTPPAIVQHASLVSVLSANGASQHAARFHIRARALFVDVRLPGGATLWSITLDGKPTKPQRDGDRLLLDIPAPDAGMSTALRRIHVVYALPIDAFTFSGSEHLVAPELRIMEPGATSPQAVPMADLRWVVSVPEGYRVTDADGSAVTQDVPRRALAAENVLRWLWFAAGGEMRGGCLLVSLGAARRSARQMKGTTQARGIQQAMVIYAQTHDGRYPPDIATLVIDDYVSIDYVISPQHTVQVPDGIYTWDDQRKRDWVNTNASFVLTMAGQAHTGDRDRIAVYEKIVPGSGGSVAFDDGHTEFMHSDEAAAAVAAETGEPPITLDPIATRSAIRFGDNIMADAEAPMAPSEIDAAHEESRTRPGRRIAMGGEGHALDQKDAPEPAPSVTQQKFKGLSDLSGVRTLRIDLETGGPSVVFHSFGDAPQVRIDVAHTHRSRFLQWAVILLVVLAGMTQLHRSAKARAQLVVVVMLIATAVAVIFSHGTLRLIADAVFYGAAFLACLYIVLAALRAVRGAWRARRARRGSASTVAAAGLAAVACLMSTAPLHADDSDAGPPITLPEHAIIVPFDPDGTTAVRSDDKLLVPYARFAELWNRAHPDRPLDAVDPARPSALAGASYSATLGADDVLTLRGRVDVAVFVDDAVDIALPIDNATVTRATLDGRPAHMRIASIPQPEAPSKQQVVKRDSRAVMLMRVTGKGRHQIDIELRVPLSQQGGWQIVEAVVPAAPATMLQLQVPAAQTDVLLGNEGDRALWEIDKPDQQISTTLPRTGALRMRWRPRVARGTVDQSLKSEAEGVIDIQEDGVRATYAFNLSFARGQRDRFDINVPGGYLVEKVAGINVRGWQRRSDSSADVQRIEIELLKPASDSESLTVYLRMPGRIGSAEAARVAAPAIYVAGAALERGTVTIRRSPLLRVRTTRTDSVARTDIPQRLADGEGINDDSPLGLRPYEAYRFVSTPFAIDLAVEPLETDLSAEVQTITRIAQRERLVESRVMLSARGRPLFRAQIELPRGLDVTDVRLADAGDWHVEKRDDAANMLNVTFHAGLNGSVPIIVTGQLGERGFVESIDVPTFRVVGAQRHTSYVVAQADPTYDVVARELDGCEQVLPDTVAGWLRAEQRQHVQRVIRSRGDTFSGRFLIVPRKPEVSGHTLSNVRVGERNLLTTMLIDLTVLRAGIRTIVFTLPAALRGAQIDAPLLREKTIEALGDGETVRVTLTLQDDVIGNIRVLIRHDEPLIGDTFAAPLPVVETGNVNRRFVTIENAGRDEVVVAQADGLEKLSRQQSEWKMIAGLLSGGSTQAFVARGGDEASLAFTLERREAVQTAGARIALAQTVLGVDANGTYRGKQIYRVDNTTEQYLEVMLPPGASLWTAHVDGEPVKPVAGSQVQGGSIVRVPLVKTVAGELDYPVVLKYGGTLDMPGGAGKTSMPLMQTRNISVELSQVRLFLPDTLKWFSFGGTMRRVTDAGGLEAGYVSYQTKRVQRLIDTLSSSASNEYAQVRAVTNLSLLKKEVGGRHREQAAQYSANKDVAIQLRAQDEVLSRVDQQLEEAESKSARWRGSVSYNDGVMTEMFERQDNYRSNNIVQDVDANFNAELKKQAEPTGESSALNRYWLDNSDLDKRGASGREKQPTPNADPAKPQAYNYETLGGKLAAPEQRAAEQVGDRQGQAAQAQQVDEVTAARAARYRRQLELNEENTAAWSSLEGAGVGGDLAGANARDIQMPDDTEAIRSAGLASLDVDLPTRGIEYQFTTPRGGIEITARAVQSSTLDTVKRLAILAVVIGLLFAVVRLGQRILARLRDSRVAIAVMFVVGVIGVLGGVLPVLSAVVVIASAVFAVRRARRKPDAAHAAV